MWIIWGVPIWFWGFIAFCFISMIFIIIDKDRKAKKYRNEKKLKNAKQMWTHQTHPPFGIRTFRLNDYKWVIIEWDKYKDILNVYTPDHQYWTPEKFKLGKGTLHWKLSQGKVPERTTIEKYMKRQVM